MEFNLKIKLELTNLFEKAFEPIQRGDAVLQAIYNTLEKMKPGVSQEINDFFSLSRSQLLLGEELQHILTESELFKDPSLKPEKNLLEQAYKEPTQIMQHWLDWMRGTSSFKLEESAAYTFLHEFLVKKGPLWIVGEEASALEHIRRLLEYESHNSNCQIYSNGNYETIYLRCKRGELKPAAGQLVLWVNCDRESRAIIVGLDEISGRIPGSAEFYFNRIFQLKKNLILFPTGYIPMCFETLGLNSKFSTKLFNEH